MIRRFIILPHRNSEWCFQGWLIQELTSSIIQLLSCLSSLPSSAYCLVSSGFPCHGFKTQLYEMMVPQHQQSSHLYTTMSFLRVKKPLQEVPPLPFTQQISPHGCSDMRKILRRLIHSSSWIEWFPHLDTLNTPPSPPPPICLGSKPGSPALPLILWVTSNIFAKGSFFCLSFQSWFLLPAGYI